MEQVPVVVVVEGGEVKIEQEQEGGEARLGKLVVLVGVEDMLVVEQEGETQSPASPLALIARMTALLTKRGRELKGKLGVGGNWRGRKALRQEFQRTSWSFSCQWL